MPKATSPNWRWPVNILPAHPAFGQSMSISRARNANLIHSAAVLRPSVRSGPFIDGFNRAPRPGAFSRLPQRRLIPITFNRLHIAPCCPFVSGLLGPMLHRATPAHGSPGVLTAGTLPSSSRAKRWILRAFAPTRCGSRRCPSWVSLSCQVGQIGPVNGNCDRSRAPEEGR